MTGFRKQFHRLKFRLWYFSRVYPTIGRPLRWGAQAATSGFMAAHQARLAALGDSLFPADRYARSGAVPCQCVVVTDRLSPDDARGLSLLLNHLRIPYHRSSTADLGGLVSRHDQQAVLLLMSGASDADANAALDATGQPLSRAVVFGRAGSQADRVSAIAASASALLPDRSGLRSAPVRAFVAALQRLPFPLLTGKLPRQAALRIDDVAGSATCSGYATAMVERGWVPNLGIFIADYDHAGAAASVLAELDADGRIEASPHAMTAYDFLFFNYKDGEPFADSEFASRWRRSLDQFARWGLAVSPVLNAHFHAFSARTFPLLAQSGVKYVFSELAPDGIGAEPGPHYLPSGDPLCTTGQSGDAGITQIHSGDPTLCCNLPSSTYDFLMHNDPAAVVTDAGTKIADRIALSLDTGFSAFATTHEYLIDALAPGQFAAILDEADRRSTAPFDRVPMSELGRSCANHTRVMVDAARWQGGSLRADLRGRSDGPVALSILGRGAEHLHQAAAFDAGRVVEVNV